MDEPSPEKEQPSISPASSGLPPKTNSGFSYGNRETSASPLRSPSSGQQQYQHQHQHRHQQHQQHQTQQHEPPPPPQQQYHHQQPPVESSIEASSNVSPPLRPSSAIASPSPRHPLPGLQSSDRQSSSFSPTRHQLPLAASQKRTHSPQPEKMHSPEQDDKSDIVVKESSNMPVAHRSSVSPPKFPISPSVYPGGALEDMIVVGTDPSNGVYASPDRVASDHEDVVMEEAENTSAGSRQKSVEPPYPKRKRSSIYHELDEEKLEQRFLGDDEVVATRGVGRPPKPPAQQVQPPAAVGQRHIVLGYWRDSAVPDEKERHIVVGFIDSLDRLRTRIQQVSRTGRNVAADYPLPSGSGGSWVTFERIVFDKHLVGLDHNQVKEYVKIRGETVSHDETPEEIRVRDKSAVSEAIRRAALHPLADNMPAPQIAYGRDLPDYVVNATRHDKKRRTTSSSSYLIAASMPGTPASGTTTATAQRQDDDQHQYYQYNSYQEQHLPQHLPQHQLQHQTPYQPLHPPQRELQHESPHELQHRRQAQHHQELQHSNHRQPDASIAIAPAGSLSVVSAIERSAIDLLPGTRPTKILLGFWRGSSEERLEDKHAVFGILGAKDMFRVKVTRETRDGRHVLGNFPTGAGALWIHYDEVEFEKHIRHLSRPEVKEYVRVRQRQLDEGEKPEQRAENEIKAVSEAQNRVINAGGVAQSTLGTAGRVDTISLASAANLSQVSRHSDAGGGGEMDATSYANDGRSRQDYAGHDLRQARRTFTSDSRDSTASSIAAAAVAAANPFVTRPGRHSLPDRPARSPDLRAGRQSLGENNGPASYEHDDHQMGRNTDRVERTNSLARQEVARIESMQMRNDQRAASREAAVAGGSGGASDSGVMDSAGKAGSTGAGQPLNGVAPNGNGGASSRATFTENIGRLNKVWASQEAARLRASGEDAKIYMGVKYERKQSGPFQGKLVSPGTILSIDGEDYVEYRVLTKPTFF